MMMMMMMMTYGQIYRVAQTSSHSQESSLSRIKSLH